MLSQCHDLALLGDSGMVMCFRTNRLHILEQNVFQPWGTGTWMGCVSWLLEVPPGPHLPHPAQAHSASRPPHDSPVSIRSHGKQPTFPAQPRPVPTRPCLSPHSPPRTRPLPRPSPSQLKPGVNPEPNQTVCTPCSSPASQTRPQPCRNQSLPILTHFQFPPHFASGSAPSSPSECILQRDASSHIVTFTSSPSHVFLSSKWHTVDHRAAQTFSVWRCCLFMEPLVAARLRHSRVVRASHEPREQHPHP